MNAVLITIGDELLIGQVIDTNSAFIAQELNYIGISVYQIVSVQDNQKHILEALNEAEKNADVIIITGGLGPTKDDITKKTLAHFFNDYLVENETVLKHIQNLWKLRKLGALNQLNKDQALVPTKAQILMNHLGTAPGMWFSKPDKIIIALPGVPYEMKALMQNEVIPKLKQLHIDSVVLHKTLMLCGVPESDLALHISKWEDALPIYIKLAYLPNFNQIRLRLTAKGDKEKELNNALNKQITQLMPLVKDWFFGFENEFTSLEAKIAATLTQNRKTLAVAESCTGGVLATKFTANPGASAYFNGSVITYSAASKTEVLGVSDSIIKAHSVVSAQVAEAMAQGVLKLYNSDFAISTTGNAGPTKGESDAEIGTVFIAIATKSRVISKQFVFGNGREKVVNSAVSKGLELLLKEILKN